MNDGSLTSRSTKAASSSVKRRSVSRRVASSGRIAKARLLETWQTVAELHPPDVVAEPGMMCRRKRPGRIQAARGDIHETCGMDMLVHQVRSTGAAEMSPHLGR